MFTGGLIASVAQSVSFLFLCVLVITAMVGKLGVRALAIGALVPIICYLCLLRLTDKNEFEPYNPALPTSQLLGTLYSNVVQQTWTDMATGQELPEGFDSYVSKNPNASLTAENLDRKQFMICGHCLIMLVFSAIGSRVAFAIHQKQNSG